MARPRRPGFQGQDRDGPGLTFLLVALVVIAIAGAKFLGFAPGKSPAGQAPQGKEPGAASAVGSPFVAVYAAHPTENYSPQPPHANGSGDVVTVSNHLAQALKEAGAQATLVTPEAGMWDEAFVLARVALEPVLADSKVTAVVDVHRDALEGRPDGYCTALVNGRPVAKLLLIVGDLDNPYVEENLAFAQKLLGELEAIAPGITRGVKVLHQAVNGDLHPNSVQVHIGEYADNDIGEAKAAAEILAKALEKTLRR